MLFNLLTGTGSNGGGNGNNWVIYLILAGFLALMIVPSFIRQKKEKKAQEEKLNAMTVGAKVTTIGLIHGEIVDVGEVYAIIKTGTEENPSFITVEKRAIYQVHKDEEVAEDAQEDLPEEIEDEEVIEEPVEAVEAVEAPAEAVEAVEEPAEEIAE